MQRFRHKLKFAPLILLIVVGGLVLSVSNHWHKGMPKPGSLALQTPVVSDSAAVTVQIRNFDFIPRELTVRNGAVVTWVNRDSAPHDATEEGRGWGTGMLKRGENATLIFDSPGAYRYSCTIHPNMKATLIVM